MKLQRGSLPGADIERLPRLLQPAAPEPAAALAAPFAAAPQPPAATVRNRRRPAWLADTATD